MERTVLLLLAIVICSSIKINAQDLKGSFYIDGNVNFSKDITNTLFSLNSGETSEFGTKTFGLTPNIGYGISNRFLIGVGVNYQQIRTESLQQQSNPSSGYSTIFIRRDYTTKTIAPTLFLKYLKPLSNKILFGVMLNLEYGKEKTKNNLPSSNFSGPLSGPFSNPITVASTKDFTDYYGLSLSPEILFFVTKKIGLRANFNGFSFVKKDAFATKKTTEYSFDLNPSNWTFGVFVLLGGKEIGNDKPPTE